MKTKKLIEHLQKVVAEHGDVPIILIDEDGWTHRIEDCQGSPLYQDETYDIWAVMMLKPYNK